MCIRDSNVGAGDPLPQVGVNKDFQDSISSLKKSEVSQPVVIPGNKIVMAVCTADTPPHPAGFDEVENKVRDALVKNKLNKLLDQKATQLVDKAKADGGDLEAAAKSMGLEAKTSDPVDRAGAIEGLGSAGMLPDAFSKPAGSIIGPNALGLDTKVVCKVVEKVPADPSGLAVQRDAIRAQLQTAASDAVRDGSAIAIGHPHPETIAALAETVPALEARGIRMVFASDLVH